MRKITNEDFAAAQEQTLRQILESDKNNKETLAGTIFADTSASGLKAFIEFCQRTHFIMCLEDAKCATISIQALATTILACINLGMRIGYNIAEVDSLEKLYDRK